MVSIFGKEHKVITEDGVYYAIEVLNVDQLGNVDYDDPSFRVFNDDEFIGKIPNGTLSNLQYHVNELIKQYKTKNNEETVEGNKGD